MDAAQKIKDEILALTEKYFDLVHADTKFIPGVTPIHYAGRVFDEKEMLAASDSVLEFWLTLGRYNEKFEKEFGLLCGLENVAVTNSGSSSNLLAVSALMSNQLAKPVTKGGEVITPASTFPTTLNPILQNGLTPVFLDIELGTYNMDLTLLQDSITDKTRAIMVPHVLGNPCEMDVLRDFVTDNDLFLIEDCCDALGSTYNGKPVGTFGDMATYSFYPAHHITMGEGGAIATNNPSLYKIIKSLRDWGRDCFCNHNEKNPMGACNNRLNYKLAGEPYDHRYVYSNIVYKLKPLDLQCDIGCEHLKKFKDFTDKRKRNFKILYDGLKQYSDKIILPKTHPKSDTNWFAFPLTINSDSFTRLELTSYLEDKKIMTRTLFAGNILKHPGYKDIKHKTVGKLENTDKVFKDSFFIGVYPGITVEMAEYVVDCFDDFMKTH